MERPCDAAKQVFNQSFNPTLPTHGGGVVVLGAAPDGNPLNAAAGITECGSVTDVDCAPGLSDGTGPGLRIDANLFQGNTAGSGSGGGLRLRTVYGTEVQLRVGPTLTSISPNTATHPASGSISVPVTLTGTNLAGATGLTGLGAGVSVAAGTFHVVSSTSATATLNIASTATTGARNIAVATASNGSSNTVTFTVN